MNFGETLGKRHLPEFQTCISLPIPVRRIYPRASHNHGHMHRLCSTHLALLDIFQRKLSGTDFISTTRWSIGKSRMYAAGRISMGILVQVAIGTLHYVYSLVCRNLQYLGGRQPLELFRRNGFELGPWRTIIDLGKRDGP